MVSNEKATVSLIEDPLSITSHLSYCFHFSAFTSNSLVIVCLRVGLLKFILPGVC